MRAIQLISVLACVIVLILFSSCASTTTTARIPTLAFSQYGLEPGPVQNQTKLDIDISVRTVRISDIYDYPDLFSFSLEDFPQWRTNKYLDQHPLGPLGLRWMYPFASTDASEQLLFNWVVIRNGTKHILRMRDARIYLVIEGQEPIPALSSLDELIREGERFEAMDRIEWDSRVSRMLLRVGDYTYPTGITRAFVTRKRSSFKLINDIGKEILPGFTYEGTLVFPVSPANARSAKISFFDITTKTDAAGNPLEKSQFDFSLVPQKVQMWYDGSEKRWKTGSPPAQPAR